MAIYTYYAPDGTVVRVKTGFSWPAFFFGPWWALFKQEWALLFLLTLPFVALIFIDEVFVQDSQNSAVFILMGLAYLIFNLVCGIYGNAWLLNAYERKGYKRGRRNQLM